MPPDASARGEMPFLDHLEELRWRLLKSLLAIAIGMAAGWFAMQHVDVIEFLKRPVAPYLPEGRLVFTSPTEPLLLTLKLAFVLGLVLSSPVVVYQLWAFLAPALYDREKRMIVPALSVGVVLFGLGAAACYQWVLPAALDVLFGFQREDLAPFITIDRYFSFATQFLVAFGVVAELPLVVTILAALGLVTPQFLVRHRRYAIVIGAVVAVLLTPPDAVSMMMMMVPILALYEVSILCAYVASRRRARRQVPGGGGEGRGGGGGAGGAVAGLALLLVLPLGSLSAQQPQPPPKDTTPAAPGPGQRVDTATARKLGLPTVPSRSFPASDAVIDSLLKLAGYRVTRYVAETLIVEGEDQAIYLRGKALVERDKTLLEADSIRYHEESCRLDARGNPFLFDEGTVLAGEGMRYDTCTRRGIVEDALTDFSEGGTIWYMRGDLAVDSGATRLYGSSSDVTTCEEPVPHYHFHAREIKWLNKHVMVARPAVLYVRDVPILWLPFIFQDIRRGRRSGVLVPRFGLNDLVRPTRGYERHVANVGYYFVLNDYMDLLVSADWHANRNFRLNGRTSYRWLDRFIQGSLSYSRLVQLDRSGSSSHITWNHSQSFNSRTQLSASVNYATGRQVLQTNTINPYLESASLSSNLNFSKQFDWGTLNVGGTRHQDLTSDEVTQTLPSVTFTPSPVNIGEVLTWSPSFTFSNDQGFHQRGGTLPIPGDTLADSLFFDSRTTRITFGTPIRIGRWNWSNNFTVVDNVSSRRQEFVIPDTTIPEGERRVLFAQTFETRVDWQTGINLPQLFPNTLRLGPSVSIVNQTGAGPFMIRNQFSGGEFVRQGKRLQFGLGIRPTFFGFFPGVGPIERIRHTVAPSVNYAFAPASQVSEEFASVVDPQQLDPATRSDPQQTITLGLTQTFEAKLRPTGSDTTRRRIKLLSINTSSVAYNFERAKQPDLTGWQTPSLTNTLASDLLPGFSIQLSHELWDGPVGFDSTRFDPFLTSVSTSFALTPATIRGLLGFLSLGRRATPAPAPAETPGDTTAGDLPGQSSGLPGQAGADFFPGLGEGQGFSLSVRYSSRRERPDTGAPTPPQAGTRVADLNLTFSPTPTWRATWHTQYDLDTRQFAQHVLSLQRELHRWRVNFSFLQGANGNFAFNFSVSLSDQPDIKFDYDQQSYAQ